MGTRNDDSDRSPTVDAAGTAADSAPAGHSAPDGNRRRIDHMPGAGSTRAEAINAGRHEMLTDTLRK